MENVQQGFWTAGLDPSLGEVELEMFDIAADHYQKAGIAPEKGERLAKDDFLYSVRYLRANYDPESKTFAPGVLEEVEQHHYSMIAENAVTGLAPKVIQAWDEEKSDYFAMGVYMINVAEKGRNRYSPDNLVMLNEYARNCLEVEERTRLADRRTREFMCRTGAFMEFLSPKPTTHEMPQEVIDQLNYDRMLYRFNWVSPQTGDMYTQSYSIFIPTEAVAKARGIEDGTALSVMQDSVRRPLIENATPLQKVEELILSALPFVEDPAIRDSLLEQLEVFKTNQENLEAIARNYTREDMKFLVELALSEGASTEWITDFIESRYASSKPKVKKIIDQHRSGDGFKMTDQMVLLVWKMHTLLTHNRAGIMGGNKQMIEHFVDSFVETLGEEDGYRMAEAALDRVRTMEMEMFEMDVNSLDYSKKRLASDSEVAATDPQCGGSCGPDIDDMFRSASVVERALAAKKGINIENVNYYAVCACGKRGLGQEGYFGSAVFYCFDCERSSKKSKDKNDKNKKKKPTHLEIATGKNNEKPTEDGEDSSQGAKVKELSERQTPETNTGAVENHKETASLPQAA